MQRIKDFFVRYEKHISSVALIGGFIFDSLTLRRVDLLIENAIFAFYIFLAGLCIVLINRVEVGKFHGKYFKPLHPWLAITIQFCLGNLFSGFTVFYFRSASLSASWPFLLFLAVLMIGNERLKKQYQVLIFQVSIYFIALFSYLIFLLPTFLKVMNAAIFLLSGLVSLVLIGIFIFIIRLFARARVEGSRVGLSTAVLSIWAIINIFYFTNILPPIPLALKEAEVYHSVLSKSGGKYEVSFEENNKSFFQRYEIVHIASGESVYVFSSVFAPTELETDIVHEWQYYNEKLGKWQTASKIQFAVVGGRGEGYRGYSLKQNVFTGLWRVNVETVRGQLIGRKTFRIERVDTPVSLITETK